MLERLVALLHPDGTPGAVRWASEQQPGDDIILLSWDSTSSGGGTRLIQSCLGALAEDGLLIVIAPPHRRLLARRALLRAGAEVEALYALLPRGRSCRHLVPLEPQAMRTTLGRLLAAKRPGRAVARAAATRAGLLTAAAAAPAVAFVARRPRARPLAEWLGVAAGSPIAPPAVSATHPQGDGVVAVAFAPGSSEAIAVAKVGSRASDEAARLAALGPGACAAGARIPRVLAVRPVAGTDALVESALEGWPAVELLRGRRGTLADVLGATSSWLERWNEETRTPAMLSSSMLEQAVFEPVADLAVELGEPYVRRLRALAVDCRDQGIPLVAAHNDLTMWNLVLGDDGSIGVLDWEVAAAQCLPLGDFVYAAVDAVASIDGYGWRAQSARECFAPSGRHAPLVGALKSRLAGALDLSPPIVELLTHACFLQHARTELRLGRPPDFIDVVRAL
jgi:hypothetical protein